MRVVTQKSQGGQDFLAIGKERSRILMCLMLGFALLIVARLFYLQVICADEMMQEAMGQIVGKRKMMTPRGSIYDRNGGKLAESIIADSFYVNPQDMVDKQEDWGDKLPERNVRLLAAELLAPFFREDYKSIEELYKIFCDTDRSFIWLGREMEPKVARQIREILKKNKIRGIHIIPESKRYYPNDRLAAQVLGFVGEEDKGLEGLELTYDEVIRGKSKEKEGHYDGRGRPLSKGNVKDTNEFAMNEIHLTIDIKMQNVLEISLDEAMRVTRADAATAILMDPNTGEILGMASRPTFNPNKYYESSIKEYKNRAIATNYEPGSVFKPIIGCAGLMEGKVTPTSVYNDTGQFDVLGYDDKDDLGKDRRYIRNWDGKGAGKITFSDIIKFSVNTGMADLGFKLGKENLVKYAKLFGFGETTHCGLGGEESGILFTVDKLIIPRNIGSMSIGQGVAVTPLQMLRAICAIANGGELLQPYIIKKIVAPDGRVLQEGGKKIIRKVISSEVASQMRDMMEQVVDSGGGKTAKIQGYRIAGKTGTAEKLAKDGGYEEGAYMASFVGFVPSDKPKYAMIVMLDEPKGKDAYYGSQVAAPVFKKTLENILTAQGVQPSDTTGLPSLANYSKGKFEQKKNIIRIGEDGKRLVPSLKGLNKRQVAETLSSGGLSLVPHGRGIATRQHPPAGKGVSPKARIDVWFDDSTIK